MGVGVSDAKNQEMSFRYWELLLECVVNLLLRDDDVVLLVADVEESSRQQENEHKSGNDDFLHGRTCAESPNDQELSHAAGDLRQPEICSENRLA